MKRALSVIRYFDGLSQPLQFGLALACVLLFGAVDYLTGYEAFFAVFYLLPIGFVAWYSGLRWGLVFSLLSAAIWLAANTAAGESHAHLWIPAWNTLTRFVVFAIVTILLSALRAAYHHEQQLARTDYLTGALNKRSFSDLTERELYRCRRHHRPFTIMYADLDNFKAVNDQFGHSTGDTLLREVIHAATRALRPLDVIARIGGDEFAVLLPETDSEAAQSVAIRLRDTLLQAMRDHGWAVSFSIGIVTCVDAPNTFDDLLHLADERMYAVKAAGKNGIQHHIVKALIVTEPVVDHGAA